MIRFIFRRFLALIPLLFIVSLLVFLLMSLVPGDPARAIAGPDSTPESLAAIRKLHHLDKPLLEQYWYWLKDAVSLNFGTSTQTHTNVAHELATRWPVTASLVLAAAIIALVIGIPLGVGAGIRPGHTLDNLCRLLAGIGLAVPSFVAAIALVVVLAVNTKIFPILGYVSLTSNPYEWARHMALPAFTLGLAVAAVLIRQLRAAMIDVLDSNYVRAAWARGGGLPRVVGLHALKNAAMPAVTVFGFSIGAMLGGTVIIEQIFSIPGLGPLILSAIISHDVPVVQAVTLLFVVTQLVIMLLVDLTYGVLNPKVRVG